MTQCWLSVPGTKARWVLPVLMMFWGKPEIWTQMWGILISKVGHRYDLKNVYAGHTVRSKQNMPVGRVWLSGYEAHAPGRWPRDWPSTATTVGLEFYQICYWPKGWMVDWRAFCINMKQFISYIHGFRLQQPGGTSVFTLILIPDWLHISTCLL